MIDQSRNIQLAVLPASRVGRWSVGLTAASLLALAAFIVIVSSGQRGGDGFPDNWLLTGLMVVVAATALAGLITALVAAVRGHERGLLVVIPVLWGLAVTFFTVGELAFPH